MKKMPILYSFWFISWEKKKFLTVALKTSSTHAEVKRLSCPLSFEEEELMMKQEQQNVIFQKSHFSPLHWKLLNLTTWQIFV